MQEKELYYMPGTLLEIFEREVHVKALFLGLENIQKESIPQNFQPRTLPRLFNDLINSPTLEEAQKSQAK